MEELRRALEAVRAETAVIGSLFVRAGSSTGEVVLCFRVGGWWPVVTGLLQEMHRTSLYCCLSVPQLMGILL